MKPTRILLPVAYSTGIYDRTIRDEIVLSHAFGLIHVDQLSATRGAYASLSGLFVGEVLAQGGLLSKEHELARSIAASFPTGEIVRIKAQWRNNGRLTGWGGRVPSCIVVSEKRQG